MNLSGNITNGIGQSVRRKEDFRLLTGRGSFSDDVRLPEMAHAVIARSPYAHAQIESVDKTAALGSPGVLAVLTGNDYVADGLAPIPHGASLMGRPDVAVRVRGFEPIATLDYPMPSNNARFVGEPVSMVVAETVDQAKDAAELLEIAYEPLPAVVRAADALKPGAPRLWDDAPDNLCIDIEVGDEAATAAAFQRAAHIVRLDTWVQRVTGVPMEPRTTTAEYDPTTGNYTLYAGSGRGVAKLRLDLAQVLGVPAEQIRCVCGDMGGNFGTRNFFYPEYALLAWGRAPGRPASEMDVRADRGISKRLSRPGFDRRG
jgi:carbon-monoxide dehydrogenase large subunit